MTATILSVDASPAGHRQPFRVCVVRVDGTARPGIVPGYPGSEVVEVTVHDDGSVVTCHLTRGRYGYRPNMGSVRSAAVRAARRHLAAA